MYRGMLYGVVLRNYLKQVVSLIRAENMSANMHKFLSWTQKHFRIDATTSTLQRKTGEPTFVVPCPSGCTEFTHKGSKEHFVRSTCKIRGTVRKDRRTPRLDSTPCSQRHTDHREKNPRIRYIESIVQLALILLCVRSKMLTRQHVLSIIKP